MIELELRQIAEIVGGIIGGEKSLTVNEVSTDTRNLSRGALFFALKGERFDGHDFLIEAERKGAIAGVVCQNHKHKVELDIPVIRVKDTLEALQKLASFVREKSGVKVVGITGSTGKTTTKDFLSSILKLRFKTVVAPGNFNNEVGVPLTLLQLKEESEVAVVELAMRGVGEVAELASLCRPDVGVVTNVGLTHYELLGSEEAIARAKAELVESLSSRGVAILNFDDPWFSFLKSKTRASVISFGLKSEALVRAENITLDGKARSSFVLVLPEGKVKVTLPYPGRHYVQNALAAAATAFALGVGIETIKTGLERARFSSMRMQVLELGEVILINDAYNANPHSMQAALQVLQSYRGKRKIACLGDMLELGEISPREHLQLGEAIASAGFDLVVLLGKDVSYVEEGAFRGGFPLERLRRAQSHEEAASIILDYLEPGDVVLFKASRGVELEKVFEKVKEALSS